MTWNTGVAWSSVPDALASSNRLSLRISSWLTSFDSWDAGTVKPLRISSAIFMDSFFPGSDWLLLWLSSSSSTSFSSSSRFGRLSSVMTWNTGVAWSSVPDALASSNRLSLRISSWLTSFDSWDAGTVKPLRISSAIFMDSFFPGSDWLLLWLSSSSSTSWGSCANCWSACDLLEGFVLSLLIPNCSPVWISLFELGCNSRIPSWPDCSGSIDFLVLSS